MRFASLEAFGLHAQLISTWEADIGSCLLPIQEKAAKAGLLQGRSLVAIAPGSAGKTLVAEMALGRALQRQAKGLYLSPTRALAEQKWTELKQRFGPLGVKVLITTRDHWQDDDSIICADFQILVTVPEKARALLAQNPALVPSFSVVIADEIQLLSDRERGPALELLLADLLALADPQIIALSAAAANGPALAAWLKAELVQEDTRPVELRVGTLVDGEFLYREHNTRQWGREHIEARAIRDGWAGAAGGLALALAERGEATIVFVRDKTTANRLAAMMAQASRLAPAEQLAQRLAQCSDTAGVNMLRQVAAAGVAVHHADLQAAERAAVEQALLDGELLAVVATSSLALGVNLPAKNVIIDPVQWRPPTDGDERPSQQPLPLLEFLAMAGRAGRLRYHDSFGRAILLATSDLQRDTLITTYVETEAPAVRPAMLDLEPEDLVAALATSLLAAQRGVEEAWRQTFSAASTPTHEWQARTKPILTSLANAGFLDGDSLRPTPKLRAAAGATVDLQTLAWVGRIADNAPDGVDWLDALALVCSAPYMHRFPFPLSRSELRQHDFVRQLLAFSEDRGIGGSLLRNILEASELSLLRKQRAAKMVLTLCAWASSLSPAEVEQITALPAGRLESVASSAAWLMQVGVEMAAAAGWPKAAVQRLSDAARAIRIGVAVGSTLEGLAKTLSPTWGICEALQSTRKHEGAVPTSPADKSPVLAPADAPAARENVAVRKLGTARRQKDRHSRTGRPKRKAPSVVLELDESRPDAMILYGDVVPLRPLEFRLMWRLAQEAGACISAQQLVAHMLGPEEWVGAHQLYPHVARLRQKMRAIPSVVDPAQLLATVPRAGLRLNLTREQVALRTRSSPTNIPSPTT